MRRTISIILFIFCFVAYVRGQAVTEDEPFGDFEYYGEGVAEFDGMSRPEVIELLGKAGHYENYEYCECFDGSGRQIRPLYYRYVHYLNQFFAREEWRNINGSGETLVLYYMSAFREDPDPRVFWGIRCRPKEVKSVMEHYIDNDEKKIKRRKKTEKSPDYYMKLL